MPVDCWSLEAGWSARNGKDACPLCFSQNWANQYDNEGKLTNVNVTDTMTHAVQHQYAYGYDAAGNRTSGDKGTGIFSMLTDELSRSLPRAH